MQEEQRYSHDRRRCVDEIIDSTELLDKISDRIADRIANQVTEKVADKVEERLATKAFAAIGKTFVQKLFYLVGTVAVGVYIFLNHKGVL